MQDKETGPLYWQPYQLLILTIQSPGEKKGSLVTLSLHKADASLLTPL